MSTDINIERNLIGVQDILFGVGNVTQNRGGKEVVVSRFNASNFPYDENLTLEEKIASLDTTQYVDANNLPVYIATPHSSSNLNLLDVIWIKDISASEKHVYYYDKLMFKYNSQTGNLILDPSLFAASVAAITIAFNAADTALLNVVQGLINNEISARSNADAAIISAYQAADSALITSLNLKSAANYEAGTGPNQVLLLNSQGQLPPIDGSQLQNLPLASPAVGTPLKTYHWGSGPTLAIDTNNHNILPSDYGVNKGFTIFNVNHTPTPGYNVKAILKLSIPTKGIAAETASSAVAIATIFINNSIVRTVRGTIGSVLTAGVDYVTGSAVNIKVNVGILRTGGGVYQAYYINDTSYGNTIVASLQLDEIKNA